MKIGMKVGFILAFAGLIGFAGCNKSGKDGLTPVKMATNPFVGNAAFYVAMEKGYFEEEGIDFSLVNFDDSSSACTALATGNCDLAYSTLDAALITESQTADEKLKITMVIDESNGADGILAKNDIKSIADLKGKTVAVSISQTTHYLLLQALNKAGISDSELNLVNMNSSDAGVAFIAGSCDAAVTWEPYLSNAVTAGAGKVLFSSADAPGSIVDVLVVQKDHAADEWITRFKAAYDKGLAYVNDPATKEDAMTITARYLDTDAAEASDMISTVKMYDSVSSKEVMKVNAVLYNAVKNISQFYFERNIIPRAVSPDSVIAE